MTTICKIFDTGMYTYIGTFTVPSYLCMKFKGSTQIFKGFFGIHMKEIILLPNTKFCYTDLKHHVQNIYAYVGEI